MADILPDLVEWYPIFMIVTGVMGIIMGWDRLWKTEEEESKKLQIAAVFSGVIVNTMIILAIYNEAQEITNWTIMFGLFFGVSMYAKPFRKLPVAFGITSIVGLLLAYFVIVRKQDDESVFAGIKLRWVILVIVIIMIVVFIIGFIQEATLDIMLLMLSWGVLVITLSIIMILQGITLLIEQPDASGILGLLPGGGSGAE